MGDEKRSSIYYEAFSKNLRNLMSSHGLSIPDLSEQCGIGIPTIHRYINGARQNPQLDYVVQLAHFFHVNLEWFIGTSDEMLRDLPTEMKELFSLYMIASEDDRKVINLLLEKYKKGEQHGD